MPTNLHFCFRRTTASGPSLVARVLAPVTLLSTLAVGAALLLASPPASAQETEPSTESTATPTITLSVNPTSVTS